ncbi:unnamed protein product [Dibothriocephalus latus]|uniref:Uncharacterized protein n=1 Tax=Dibothriocephalus latus TaxID=60516 RepID=A0A3P7LAR5_DIBLA|nr:unnamed protein product [Dibothriocephalus latus]
MPDITNCFLDCLLTYTSFYSFLPGSDILSQSNGLRESPGGLSQRHSTSGHFTNRPTMGLTPTFYETYQHNPLAMSYLDAGQQYQLTALPREMDEAYQNQTDFHCAGMNYAAAGTATVAYEVAVNGAFPEGVQFLGPEGMLTPVPRSAATSVGLEGSRFNLRETLLGTPLTASTPDNCSAEATVHLDGQMSRGLDETASVFALAQQSVKTHENFRRKGEWKVIFKASTCPGIRSTVACSWIAEKDPTLFDFFLLLLLDFQV